MGSYEEMIREVAELPVEFRALALTATITRALADVGFQAPTLVGGAAAEFWSQGQCTTVDVDLVLYTPHEKVDAVMIDLGFIKSSDRRHWRHGVNLDLYVEFPASTLDVPFKSIDIKFGDGYIKIMTPESIVADRLAQFSLNGDTFLGSRAILISHARGSMLDWAEVTRMAIVCNVPQDLVDRVREYVEAHQLEPFPEGDKLADEIYALYSPDVSAMIAKEEPDDDDA